MTEPTIWRGDWPDPSGCCPCPLFESTAPPEPGTAFVILTKADYERLMGGVDDAQREADEWQARWEDQDHQWVKDHPAEAAQALIEAGALEQVGWQRERGDLTQMEPPAHRVKHWQPVYRRTPSEERG